MLQNWIYICIYYSNGQKSEKGTRLKKQQNAHSNAVTTKMPGGITSAAFCFRQNMGLLELENIQTEGNSRRAYYHLDRCGSGTIAHQNQKERKKKIAITFSWALSLRTSETGWQVGQCCLASLYHWSDKVHGQLSWDMGGVRTCLRSCIHEPDLPWRHATLAVNLFILYTWRFSYNVTYPPERKDLFPELYAWTRFTLEACHLGHKSVHFVYMRLFF